MGVYTKTGDKGWTSLYSGERVAKDSLRVEAYGTVDEADSALGMARAFCRKAGVQEKIMAVQKKLPRLMADIASRGQEPGISLADVAAVEDEIDKLEAALPPLQSFIIPGSSQGGAMLDLARTSLRRAERRVVALAAAEEVHEADRLFLNRLSDYCFMLLRWEEA
jgi:cob(I)alamin adenosyltransferase